MRPFGTTIFAEMSALAVATGSINLGQGFPDTDGPDDVKQAAVDAINAGHNQYPPGIGVPELRHAIATHQPASTTFDYDADAEVLVTAGATEAIAAALLALCEPGDEVVTFEPYYDSYAACIAIAGADAARRDPASARLVVRSRRVASARSPPARSSSCSTRPTTQPAKCSRAPSSRASPNWRRSTTCSSSPTRSTSIWCSKANTFRSQPCPACANVRSRFRRAARRSRSPGGRSAGSARRLNSCRRSRPSKQFLTYVSAGRSSSRSPSGSSSTTRTSPAFRRMPRTQARPAVRGLGRSRVRRAAAARHVLRHHRHSSVRRTRRPRVLSFAAGTVWCGRGSERRVLRRRCGRRAARSLGVLQTDGSARRRVHAVEERCGRDRRRYPARHRVGRPGENFAHLAPMIADAARSGARLVVLTEMFSTGFSMKTERTAETPDGAERRSSSSSRHATTASGCARPFRSALAPIRGRSTSSSSPRPTARRIATPRSTRSRFGREHEHYSRRATHSSPSTIEGVRCSFFVCYDLRFADEFWALAPTTDCYVIPANWPAARREHWMTLLRARAIENQAYVVGVNRVGDGGKLALRGRLDDHRPFGEIVAHGRERRDDHHRRCRPRRASRRSGAEYPFLQDRR